MRGYRRRRSLDLILLVLGAMLWADNPALAQEEGEEDLEMQMYFAPAETITSAARHIQPLELSPSAVSVLTREDIVASGARTLPEALRLIPNMDINMVKPLWYTIGIRGLTYITSDTMLLLVDGRDVTFEFFGFPMWTVQHFSMDDVERIEVIRGPGSALYGSNAYAGVVNVITRKPGDTPRAMASLRGGEHGQFELEGRGSAVFGPLALAISGGLEREDMWTSRDVSGREVSRGRLVGSIDLGGENSLRIDTGIYDGKGRFYTNLGDTTVRDGKSIYALACLDLGDLSIQTYYDLWMFDLDFGFKLIYPPLNNLKLAEVPSTVARIDKFVTSAQHSLEFVANRLTYGVEYVFNRYHSEVLVDPLMIEHRFGVYAQDELDLKTLMKRLGNDDFMPLSLTAGLRFDYNSITEYEFSPRAALVLSPGANHTIRLGYAHAFQKPTLFESSLSVRLENPIDPGLTSLSMANPNLRNETIDSLELGYRASFADGRFVLRVDLAYNWYRDSIWFTLDPNAMEYIQVGGLRIPRLNGPGFNFQNTAGSDGYDVEIETIYLPTKKSRLFFQAGYRQLFENGSGKFGEGEPVWRMAAGADLSGEAGWTISLRAFYCSAFDISFSSPAGSLAGRVFERVPAWWRLNARVAWAFMHQPFKVSTGIEAFDLLGFKFREFGGLTQDNNFDFAGERSGRRILLFIQGEI
jgi:outer membrane receptor protein involved in Fe transport